MQLLTFDTATLVKDGLSLYKKINRFLVTLNLLKVYFLTILTILSFYFIILLAIEEYIINTTMCMTIIIINIINTFSEQVIDSFSQEKNIYSVIVLLID